MWWLFTEKIQRHSAIASDEEVIHACYGLGARIVEFANRSISPVSSTWSKPVTTDGLASPINCNGVLALTDLRLCFFPKMFAFGTPKAIKADWPLEVVDQITYENKQLRIAFQDGSVAGLHVPSSQSPQRLIDAFSKSGRGDVVFRRVGYSSRVAAFTTLAVSKNSQNSLIDPFSKW